MSRLSDATKPPSHGARWAGKALPLGWSVQPLGAVAAVFNGRATGTGGTRVRVFKTKHVYDGLVRLEMPEYVPDRRIDDLPSRTLLRAGDVLTPNMAHGTIGRVAFVTDAAPNWTVDGQVMVVRATTAVPGFIFAVMSMPQTRKALVELEKGGAFGERRGQTHIYPRNVADILVPIAPVSDQREIAAVLAILDETIRRTARVVAKLKQVKQGLLHDLLTRGIDDNGELRDPERHPEQFKDSPLGRIPRGWETTTLGACLSGSPQNGVYKPGSHYGETGSAIVRIDGFYDGALNHLSTFKRVRLTEAELKLYRLEAGNILINRVNSIDYVGKAALVPLLDEAVAFESNIMRLRLDRARLEPTFAIRVLCAQPARRFFFSRAKSAIAQASVNQTDVREVPLPVPEVDEQQSIAATIDTCEARLNAEESSLGKARLLKKGLMEDLLTGRVRVTNLLELAAE